MRLTRKYEPLQVSPKNHEPFFYNISRDYNKRTLKRTTRLLLLTTSFISLLVAVDIAVDQELIPRILDILTVFPGADKVAHFIVMGTLSLLVGLTVLAYHGEKSWQTLLRTILVIALASALEEYTQNFFPNRHASWVDLASSLAGIVVFGVIAWLSTRYGCRRYARARN